MAKTSNTLTHAISRDGQRVAVQVGSSFAVADETGTPITSPMSYTTGVYTLVVPDNAVEFICMPTTDLKVSDTVGVTTYDLVVANSKEAFGCAGMANIYVQRVSSNGTLYFRFTIV